MEKRLYEVLLILPSNLNEEGILTELAKFDENVKNLGGNIEKLERQGKRKLGFNIKKHNDGYFVIAYVTLEVDKVERLKENCKYADNILRYFVTRKEAA
ncbi:MAG: hypothetical protein KatS3mg068_0211 [Candidatus Sericytochromatia bacterium]|nr:MAG: hypothetical protein KatS3mg068_0211 [Candidatus Sericytochromatia bacterium]